MEGILFEAPFEGIASFLGGFALLAVVAAGIVLGYVKDEEARGAKVHWTAEPVPGTEEAAPAEMEEIRLAA